MPKPPEQITPKQYWLSERLKHLKDKQTSHRITPQSRPPTLPLSFAQQRLWFLEQWEPRRTDYLLPFAWRLKGPLSHVAFEASLKIMAERHENLRTSFSIADGHPMQVIAPVARVSLVLRDLTALPVAAQESELQNLIHQETKEPFDLATGPLWRSQLLRLGPEDHVLLLTLHHIITDGWSMGIMFKELSTLYTAQVTGQPATLPPLPIQYADFAIWQRQRLRDQELERQLTYWRTQLAEVPPYLDFPTDAPRPQKQTYRGDQVDFTLPPMLTLALKNLSQREGVTLFMSLLAAFQVLLFRYTAQRDIVVGTPIAGRTHIELENLIGFFVNTLVIRTKLMGQPTFREVLQQVRETCLEAYTHQDLPFEQLVAALQPVRDPTRHPLFQVMFQLHQGNSIDGLTLPSLKIVNLTQASQTAKFDLSVFLAMRRETLQGTITFNTDLFNPASIRRLATHYHTLLEGLVNKPTQVVHHLPLLNAAEQKQLLVEGNPPRSPMQSGLCIHHLFEAQAARTPEAVAIIDDDHHLTYAILEQRANQLARCLIGQGVGQEIRVGVILNRGLEMIISLLAILKAGGAYVPLDPATPHHRLSFMLEDAKVEVVLTSAALRSQFAACLQSSGDSGCKGWHVIIVDRELPEDSPGRTISASRPAVHTENLAYVMYTSGSTGKPKGIAIPHRGVVRLITNPAYLKWPTPAICLQLASPAFDAATFEIWACLVQGGTLVLGPTMLSSLDQLGVLLQRHQITLLWLTAGLFHQMVDWNIQGLGTLQTLLAGGDVLSPQHVRRVTEQLPTCRMINGYGPTENTTFTCCFSIPPDGNFGNSVPIGRPIAHTEVYLLDARQHLVPWGVTGELCIGGLGLGRGYHGQPALTAEHFIPHPFGSVPGGRLFRSGDMGRYRPDGTIEFLGRRDHQVKIRGYRIECGEIETILKTHPTVREILVLPREDSVGNKHLVAYLVPQTGTTPNISEYRDFLNRTLPSYMIPGGFVFLDAFPLTSNGKVDRRKLLDENLRSSQGEEPYVAPRNILERRLVKIWEIVFGRQPIGIHDNFFDLGGESLLAVRMCSEMERALQKKFPIPLIFHAQTIEQLAKEIAKSEDDTPGCLMVPIQPSGSNPPIFCFGFGSNFKRYLRAYPNQPVYMFLNPGYDGRPVLNTSVEKIANQCLKEMRTVQPEGPYYLAGYSFGGLVVYEMAQQLRRQGETINFLALVDPTTPFAKTKPSPPKHEQSTWLTSTRLQGNPEAIHFNFTNISHAIFTKTQGAIHWRWNKLINSSWINIRKLLCNIYFGFHYPLPTFLRRFYRDVVVREAAKQYAIKNYSGPIVLFQTKQFVKTYWSQLCGEVVQVYDLPCTHVDIYLDRHHTPMFLNQLMNHLEKPKNLRNETGGQDFA